MGCLKGKYPSSLAVDRDEHVSLAERSDGKHYSGGVLVSSVLKPTLKENRTLSSGIGEGRRPTLRTERMLRFT